MTSAGTKGKGRHLWVAGRDGQWLEDCDGDTHTVLMDGVSQLADDVADDLALKGEIMGGTVRAIVSSMGAFWGDAWGAFATAEAHLVQMGHKRLSLFAWVEGKSTVIPLGGV